MSKLTLSKLIELNPSLYEQCVAKGIAMERNRCVSHLPQHVTGEAAKLAIKNVKSGAPLTEMCKAEYLCIQLKKIQAQNKREYEAEIVCSFIEAKFGVRNDH